jgi:hypothetical protein
MRLFNYGQSAVIGIHISIRTKDACDAGDFYRRKCHLASAGRLNHDSTHKSCIDVNLAELELGFLGMEDLATASKAQTP